MSGKRAFLDLDDPAVRRLAAEDPMAFVRDLPEPVVIDEFQRVPDVLAAIKAELNRDRRPGRFVLAGSVRHQVVPELADFLTGRVELLTLWPFAMAELVPGAASVVDRLFDGSVLRQRRASGTQRRELVEIVLRGGYPIAVGLAPEPRSRWFANLAALVVERVGEDVTPVRRVDVRRRFLRLSAAPNGSPRWIRLRQAASVRYWRPSWSPRCSSRRAGHRSSSRLYHYRTADGVEVDLVLETADGRVAGIEVKTGSQVTASALRGITQLRDRLGARFVAGLMLTSGSQAQPVGDRLSVAPVDILWRP